MSCNDGINAVLQSMPAPRFMLVSDLDHTMVGTGHWAVQSAVR